MSNTGTSWRIQGARVIDPFRGIDAVLDVTVRDGVFVEDHDPSLPVVDAKGLWLVPRLTDMHVHFRDPGLEYKEDLASGSRAAAAGGFTVVCTMPNTKPVVDIPSLVEWQKERAETLGLVRIWPIGAVTKGEEGKELAEMYQMAQAGAIGFSDDGHPVADSRIMRAALSYSATLNRPIIQHSEDPDLFAGGSMHEGAISQQLGLGGIPAEAESIMVWRDVELVQLTRGILHVAHVSAPGSLEAVRYAKNKGLAVTAEAAPHHLFLSDDAVREWQYSAVTKVNPPLRPAAMQEALIQAVTSGLIDVLASDHAPHHADEKAEPYDKAPFGISGLETFLGTVMTVFLGRGLLSPLDLFAKLTAMPHQVLRQSYAGISPGAAADLTLIDPGAVWTVDPAAFYSKGHNTPLAGATLTGRAVATMVGGRWTMREQEVLG
ncbi:MAG: dihydroorotase [Sulfobacillus thermotolerans]|uniref:Dihydroorotase n=1 Tax=Sulfobacillus thermotolerans TaxID=338644 RepID=A0ABM6RSL5_9FIRM|nr:dihydroorotase [Sulfobacillus thermotolerans]MCY0907549.1 dihydroorotase [Sulfobacillus thermotolerans]